MIHIFDGAMGTMLQNSGLTSGDCPELFNINQPQIIQQIHEEYIRHGATIIETNTFGANRIKLSHYGLSNRVSELNKAAVKIAKLAAKGSTKIAGSVGSTGKFLEPFGELSFDEAYDIFYEQIFALSQADVDYILIETIIDIQEMRAALLAAKAATKKPVICQLSFGDDGRTVTGTDPQTAAITLDALGADIIGVNCSLGPAQLLPIIEILSKNTNKPISVQPNAGIPQLINGKTVFQMEPEEFGIWAPKLAQAGATYIGGCCGTTPAHIAAIYDAVKNISIPPKKINTPILSLTSRSKTVFIDQSMPPVLLGERINPTGRKLLAAEIKDGILLSVKKEALEQVHAGAHLLDINMGVGGIQQASIMEKAIKEISQLVDVPLVIDTSDPLALEAALKVYPGRALINSVSAEPDRLTQFLPLAKKYGAAILCLPISDQGVPKTARERVAVMETIISNAQSHGLKAGDFLLDALVMTIAADENACLETLNTLKMYRKYFGYPTTMGLSNISFGLPKRSLINHNFFAMSLAYGLDAPIMNPYDPAMQETLLSSNALLGYDKNGCNYSTITANADLLASSSTISTASKDILSNIQNSVIQGEKEIVSSLINQAFLENYSSEDITERALTTAMNEVGTRFSSGKFFLPQVLLSAETMRIAFNTIKQLFPMQSLHNKGTIILATVKGDIHDLGKNIVAALLENNGFNVIDLGKDVAVETILKKTKEYQADMVGLCALMTTTMPQIDIVIQTLKKANIQTKIMVGGAVLTQEYADQAGADCYAQNGIIALNLAKKLIKNPTSTKIKTI